MGMVEVEAEVICGVGPRFRAWRKLYCKKTRVFDEVR